LPASAIKITREGDFKIRMHVEFDYYEYCPITGFGNEIKNQVQF